MLVIKEIMAIAGVDQETAFKIHNRMAIDFSRSTQAEFKREVKRVAKEL